MWINLRPLYLCEPHFVINRPGKDARQLFPPFANQWHLDTRARPAVNARTNPLRTNTVAIGANDLAVGVRSIDFEKAELGRREQPASFQTIESVLIDDKRIGTDVVHASFGQ